VKKTLILVRHAHRDTGTPWADNGLTPKGREQAEAVRRWVEERFPGETPLLLSSPKKRCRQTLEPLAKKLGTPLVVDERLLEGNHAAAGAEAFLKWWRDEAPALAAACSHGDWIPIFLGMAAGDALSLKKGACAELVLSGGKARVARVEQEPS
jgi:broad specificity phosphatase PhoE